MKIALSALLAVACFLPAAAQDVPADDGPLTTYARNAITSLKEGCPHGKMTLEWSIVYGELREGTERANGEPHAYAIVQVKWSGQKWFCDVNGYEAGDRTTELRHFAMLGDAERFVFHDTASNFVEFSPPRTQEQLDGQFYSFCSQMFQPWTWLGFPPTYQIWQPLFLKEKRGRVQILEWHESADGDQIKITGNAKRSAKGQVIPFDFRFDKRIGLPVQTDVNKGEVVQNWQWSKDSKDRPVLVSTKEIVDSDGYSHSQTLQVKEYDFAYSPSQAELDLKALKISPGSQVDDNLAKKKYRWGGISNTATDKDKLDRLSEKIRNKGFAKPKSKQQ